MGVCVFSSNKRVIAAATGKEAVLTKAAPQLVLCVHLVYQENLIVRLNQWAGNEMTPPRDPTQEEWNPSPTQSLFGILGN